MPGTLTAQAQSARPRRSDEGHMAGTSKAPAKKAAKKSAPTKVAKSAKPAA